MNLRAATITMILLSSFLSFGQQRIGLDINTTGYSLNLTGSYQKVVMKHFIINSGICTGLISQTAQGNDPIEIDNGLTVASPFQDVNTSININDTIYQLMSYRNLGRGISFEAGFGYFHEFSAKHGIKLLINGRLGTSSTETLAYYHSPGINRKKEDLFNNKHFYSAISPEINHTIRLNGRYTFCYGIKLPYYFLIDKKRFDTNNVKDGFYGLEPEFKLGITYVIGKCDE